jgi:hypothetical protein
MLMEGVPPAMIENARAWPACRSGRSRSTTRWRSISGCKIMKATEADLGAAGDRCRRRRCALEEMVEKQAGSAARTARASTTIRRRAKKRLWPGLAELQPKKLTRERSRRSTSRNSSSGSWSQALEAARTFEEGVVTDVREADVGSILGFGFAPFTGGTLSYIDMMGTHGPRPSRYDAGSRRATNWSRGSKRAASRNPSGSASAPSTRSSPSSGHNSRPVPYGDGEARHPRAARRACRRGSAGSRSWTARTSSGSPTTGGGAISLEPGGQFELSGAPVETLHQTCTE